MCCSIEVNAFSGVRTSVRTLFYLYKGKDDFMRKEHEELSDSALGISASLIMIIVLILEDYLTHSTDDTFWMNLLTAPLMFLGAFLIGNLIFQLPARLIQFAIDYWEDNLEGKKIYIIIAAIVACVIYALIKTYSR